MRVLLDTHVIVWFMKGEELLSKSSIDIIINRENSVFVSAVSIWEITIKASLGKLTINKSIIEIYEFLNSNEINVLNILPDHLINLNGLPHHHRDPFDRLLIAQAISEGLSIISADQHFKSYPADIIWE